MTEEGNKRKKAGGLPVQEDAAGNRFTKGQLIRSVRFRERRDLLDALLKDGELYTVKIVEEKIESYMKGGVK